MKNLKVRYISVLLILIGIVIILFVGYKNPPEKLKSTDIPMIHAVSINNDGYIELTIYEINYWNKLEFTKVNLEYPGETPDFEIDLIGEKSKFKAIYNKGEDIVFFSFIPEIGYGFLNSPPKGGWTIPLYKTKVTDKLLKLLKIKNTRKPNKKK